MLPKESEILQSFFQILNKEILMYFRSQNPIPSKLWNLAASSNKFQSIQDIKKIRPIWNQLEFSVKQH